MKIKSKKQTQEKLTIGLVGLVNNIHVLCKGYVGTRNILGEERRSYDKDALVL